MALNVPVVTDVASPP